MDREQLKQALASHSLWLNSEGRQGKRANLTGANLSWATGLSQADLTVAILSRADLSGVNLTQAILLEADLSGAILNDTYLSGADLYMANLIGADLIRADLSGADLTGAKLDGADLTGANLARAKMAGAEIGLEIRDCLTFEGATVSEDQLTYLSRHPGFKKWRKSLTIDNT